MHHLRNVGFGRFSVLKSTVRCFSRASRKLDHSFGFSIGRKWYLIPVTGFVLSAGYYQYKQNGKQTALCDAYITTQKLNRLKDIIQKVKDEYGSPGVVVSVSVDGQKVWTEGFGYANLESRTKCEPNTVMRIASISKSITMALVAKLWEEGKLDLDKPVHEYVKEWPEKTLNDKQITITTRQLVSHLGGIRHYDKNCGEKLLLKSQENKDAKDPGKEAPNKTSKPKDTSAGDKKPAQNNDGGSPIMLGEFEHKEYISRKHFPNVVAALDMFKHDRLCSQPGTKFLYTSHGWTLISAVVEAAGGKKFPVLAKQLFSELGLHDTYLDQQRPIIYNRASFYVKNKQGMIENAPFVDNSYKWAGGGLLSTIMDLVKFGNAMLYSYQYTAETACDSANHIADNQKDSLKMAEGTIARNVVGLQSSGKMDNQVTDNKKDSSKAGQGDVSRKMSSLQESNQRLESPRPNQRANSDSTDMHSKDVIAMPAALKPGYLKPSTMRMIWSPVNLTVCEWEKDGGRYGMGWGVMPNIEKYGYANQQPFYVSHTGGAIGCSSVLLIMPTSGDHNAGGSGGDMKGDIQRGGTTPNPFKATTSPPKGIVVAIIANMQAINLNPAALEIANTLTSGEDK